MSELNKEPKPQAVKLPQPTEPHPSEAKHVAYSDPDAPQPKRKLRVGRIVILVILLAVLIGGATAGYIWHQKRSNNDSIISDYSGGLAESEPANSVITEETKIAKQFLQAIQAGEATIIDNLASETLKQQVKLETKNDEATLLSYYEGRFDGIDFDKLISSVKDGGGEFGVTGKIASFSDASETYKVEVLVVEEAGALKINSVKSELSY